MLGRGARWQVHRPMLDCYSQCRHDGFRRMKTAFGLLELRIYCRCLWGWHCEPREKLVAVKGKIIILVMASCIMERSYASELQVAIFFFFGHTCSKVFGDWLCLRMISWVFQVIQAVSSRANGQVAPLVCRYPIPELLSQNHTSYLSTKFIPD